MPSSKIERKLAAIMFTDIAGYTEQMSKSESKSLDTLEKKRSILKPLLKEYKSFKQFYLFYLSEHMNPVCRGLHFIYQH